MEINKRIEDVSQVFDKTWKLNRDNSTRKEFLDGRKEHLKKLYNVSDKKDVMREELLRANSVNGRVENLNNRMQAVNDSQRIIKINNFKKELTFICMGGY